MDHSDVNCSSGTTIMAVRSSFPVLVTCASFLVCSAFASPTSDVKLNDGVYTSICTLWPTGSYYLSINRLGLLFPSVSFGLQVYDDDTAESLTTIALQVCCYVRGHESVVVMTAQNCSLADLRRGSETFSPACSRATRGDSGGPLQTHLCPAKIFSSAGQSTRAVALALGKTTANHKLHLAARSTFLSLTTVHTAQQNLFA